MKTSALAVAATLVWVLPAALLEDIAEASQASAHTRPAADPNPSPSPNATAKKRRWGLTVTAAQAKRVQHGKNIKDEEKKSQAEIKKSSSRRNKTTPKNAPIHPFRLNIGICGHIGGNTSNLTRCLPAIEDDRPDTPEQPNLPEAIPSRAVAVRIPLPQDVEWGQVLAESKNVLFPKLGVKVQPVGRTLVNQDTIVYTDESRVYTQTVTVLGFPVVVEAMPMSYMWSFGDGASKTTTTPGRPYPAMDITHKYLKKGGVGLTLTTSYAARFNVAGTGWQYVEGTVPITGPATALLVREAVPVLVEPVR
ncbi:PKD domain-containing protein [Kribbella sp. CA-293567]|uniref:PKD domain-containing protein n=1 Tax=Kribbella sp. CA-293567 TaxID=3002436 RepID=UPI0022DD5358|nr:PKD domain-containing protein [Kribbella sp. CA-293567]WBQ04607.1 PKD domain-containing protein [Kribbella sp. CA-293567]